MMPASQCIDLLGETLPREIAGSRTSERYDAQRNLSFLKLIELHEENVMYTLVFDYHEDLVVVDSTTEPARIDLYQIKSTSGSPLKFNSISKLPVSGAHPRSAVGKLYLTAESLWPLTRHVGFLTNTGLEFAKSKQLNTTRGTIGGRDLCDSEIANVENTLDKDIGAPRPLPSKDSFFLQVIPCALSEQRRDVVGRLASYFLLKHGSDAVPVNALYDALIGEIHRRTSLTTPNANSSLVASKSLDRYEVDVLFSRALTHRRLMDNWPIVDADLAAAGINAVERLKIRAGCLEFIARRAKGELAALKLASCCEEKRVALQALAQASPNIWRYVESSRHMILDVAGIGRRDMVNAALIVFILETTSNDTTTSESASSATDFES